MRLATHAAFGAFLTLGVASITGLRITPASLGLAVLASTLPELDHERSEIGSLLKPLSKRLARKYGHRTFTHSFVGLSAFGLLASPLLFFGLGDLWWALFVGYLSHILLDVLTPKGVCWFWPSLTPVGFGEARIKSGSAGESAVLIFCLALSILIYPIVDIGVLGALRNAFGDIDSTFEEYRRLVGSGHPVVLAGELQENATKRLVRGSWPIVDLLADGPGYWVLMDGALRSVGRGPGRDFYPLRVHVQAQGQGQTQAQAPGRGALASPAPREPVSARAREWIPLTFEVSSVSALLVKEGERIEEGQLLGYKEPDPKAETVEELLKSREVRSPVSGVIRRLTVKAQEKGLRAEALVEVSKIEGEKPPSASSLLGMQTGSGASEARGAGAEDGGSRAPPEEAAPLTPRGPPWEPPPPTADADGEGAVEVYFAPGDGPEQALLHLLRSSQRTIHLALYYFTDDELAQALAEACLRVECRVLLDEEQRTSRYSQAGLLLSRGVPVRFFTDEGIFHHKFLVVDGECVATGSYNWTESAQRRNEENLLILCDREVASQYEEEFGRLWADPRSRP